MRLFIDTGAFVSLVDPKDKHHGSAKDFFKAEVEGGGKFITTNFIVCETLNYLAKKVSRDTAVHFREAILDNPQIAVVFISPAIEAGAFNIFKKYSDKKFSYTDCTSFAVMDSLKIKHAFAFDRHFEQYGGFKRFPGLS